jgi:hypothetical protein
VGDKMIDIKVAFYKWGMYLLSEAKARDTRNETNVHNSNELLLAKPRLDILSII